MKTRLAALFVALTALFQAGAQDRADRQNLENPESFSMIVLGDPQGYIKYDINQPLFDLCTAWIADNVDHLNIKAVLCTGDLGRIVINLCLRIDIAKAKDEKFGVVDTVKFGAKGFYLGVY